MQNEPLFNRLIREAGEKLKIQNPTKDLEQVDTQVNAWIDTFNKNRIEAERKKGGLKQFTKFAGTALVGYGIGSLFGSAAVSSTALKGGTDDVNLLTGGSTPNDLPTNESFSVGSFLKNLPSWYLQRQETKEQRDARERQAERDFSLAKMQIDAQAKAAYGANKPAQDTSLYNPIWGSFLRFPQAETKSAASPQEQLLSGRTTMWVVVFLIGILGLGFLGAALRK